MATASLPITCSSSKTLPLPNVDLTLLILSGDTCDRTIFEESVKEEEELMPERKRRQLVDGAYRIVFNEKNQN